MRRISSQSALAAVLALTLSGTPLAAADDALAGERTEVVDAGFAITSPDGWLAIDPSGATIDAILAEAGAVAPALVPTIEAALGSGLALAFLTLDADSDPTFAQNCNVLVSATRGETVERMGERELAQLAGFGDVITGEPALSFVDLPAGRAARLDLALALPGFDTFSTSYLFTDGRSDFTLTCTDLARPDDGWLPIAETFELLEAPADV